MSTLNDHERAGDGSGRGYHHGDLRGELIRLGTIMLAESGAAAISLRQLAQRAGVSHNAPYQHFPDKDALIAAIAEQGFRLLTEAIAAADDGPPVERLVRVGEAYVAFALAHPAHLQVMFGAFPSSDYPDLAARAGAALERLITITRRLDAEGLLNAASPEDAAAVVWMTVHGLSAILAADKLPDAIRRGRAADELARDYMEQVCRGLMR